MIAYQECKLLSLKEITFHVESGELIIVVGGVGSGKTCLLMAILNEIFHVSGIRIVNGRISYTPQEAWCFNGSVKNNIVFGRDFKQSKYDSVIDICALQKDFQSFVYGDDTLIGEKGITLSGGQKARINLARAVYDDADLYIFDDPLSAVDSAVANHIFFRCIEKYLQSKTRILVTHNLQFINRADKIIVIKDGYCLAFGTPQQLRNRNIDLISVIDVKPEKSLKSEFDIRNVHTENTFENSEIKKDYNEYVDSKQEVACLGSNLLDDMTIYDFTTGRILNRFTADVGLVDQRIPFLILDLNRIIGSLIATMIITCVLSPYLTVVCLILLSIGVPMQKCYLRTCAVRWFGEYEIHMISTERVLEYTHLPSEASLFVKSDDAPKIWPSQGKLIFRHVFLSYTDSQPILKNLCFEIKGGSKIGIVGRTGAGKSSLINALFRLVEFDGLITIDGVDIKQLGLNDLRRKMSIIPQDPVTFDGTIRSNIDPYDEYTDETIWNTLHSVSLAHIFKAIPGDLSAPLYENGSNLSVGQRQLICMVRAL
ncbi:putative multidrug resistance-associated: lethal 03659-like isoform x5 protein, partial [Leptotrombidium deliense]